MLQKTVLTATALVLCVSVSFAGPETGQSGVRNPPRDGKPVVPMRFDQHVSAAVMIGKTGSLPARNNFSHWVPNATFNNFSKDKNAEFLSWYGFTAANISYQRP